MHFLTHQQYQPLLLQQFNMTHLQLIQAHLISTMTNPFLGVHMTGSPQVNVLEH